MSLGKSLSKGVSDGLRRLLGVDADRRALDAGLLRVSRQIDDMNDRSGRLARVETEVAEFRTTIVGQVADSRMEIMSEMISRMTQIERRLNDLDAATKETVRATSDATPRIVERLDDLASAVNESLRASSEPMLRILEELRHHVLFLEFAACRTPVYVQPGLNAVITFSGWGEPPIVVPTTHIGVLNTYQRHGVWDTERGVRTVIERELKPGEVAVDIGAHVGIHAVVMARIVGREGKLHCFEPDPDLAEALRQTFVMNGFPQATATNAAVADASGRREFFRTTHSAESSLFEPSTQAVARDHIPVDVVALDDFFAPGGRVDFVKIDAEGAEGAILRGMKRVLADNPQIRLIMEFAPIHFQRAGEDAAAFIDGLERVGFAIGAIDDKSGDVSAISKNDLLNGYTFNLWLTRQQS